MSSWSRITLLVFFFLASLALSGQSNVFAKCAVPAMGGFWKAESKVPEGGPSWMHMIHKCSSSYGKPEHWQNAEWVLEVGHTCEPRNCTWNRAVPQVDQYGTLEARFETFIARRNVKVIASGTRMKVFFRIDYRDDKKKDIEGMVLMVRAD